MDLLELELRNGRKKLKLAKLLQATKVFIEDSSALFWWKINEMFLRNVLSQLSENDFVYFLAESGVSPAGQTTLTVDHL